jgi:protein ImuB
VPGNNSVALNAPIILPARSAKELECVRETERILAILHQWGIHTVGQLAKLNRDDLALRLGTRAVELWERAKGRRERMLRLVSPPESFAESFEFENEIETSEPLLFMLRRFLQQLATRLNAIYLVARELRLRILFSDSSSDEYAAGNKSHYERVFKIPQPTNNEEILFRMLHTHLENFTSKYAIKAVELEVQPSKAVRQQFSLFEAALRDPAQLHETLARLVGLLGTERVGRPMLEETHRPDAFRIEPFAWEFHEEKEAHRKSSSRAKVEGSRGSHLKGNATGSLDSARDDSERARPALRRIRKCTLATVLLENNRPIHVRAAETEGATVANDGPFPISGNWWDEKTWAQVEWDLELENGVIACCHADEEGWALDGIYD